MLSHLVAPPVNEGMEVTGDATKQYRLAFRPPASIYTV
jgi:hypothetical protein